MKQHDTDSLVAEFVLGTLDAEARAQLLRRLPEEPDLRKAVVAWEQRLSVLGTEEPEIEPPAGLWARIEPALQDPRSEGPGSTIRANEGEWNTMAEGILKKLLFVDPEQGSQSFLLRFSPGARFPAHSHSKTEECLMLEGELRIGDLHLKAGDYHVVHAGMDHEELSSETGGLLYVRGGLHAAAG